MTYYDDEERDRPARRQRETLMQRRLRAARGEPVDDEDEIADDIEADDVRERYPRQPRYAPAPSGGGCAQTMLFAVLGVITILLLGLLLGRQMIDEIGRSVTEGVPERVREVIATPTPTVRDRGGTILQIQGLNRLETQRFSIERVVEAGVQRGDILDAFLGERLLLIASGDVIAGVDLSRIRANDVNISPDGTSITLRLPPSEIFSATLNNSRTRVYDRDTRIVTQILGGQDPTLETQARQAAESEILNAACENGIMLRAADEAKQSMEQFLRLLDFDEVTVIAPEGPCTAPGSATP